MHCYAKNGNCMRHDMILRKYENGVARWKGEIPYLSCNAVLFLLIFLFFQFSQFSGCSCIRLHYIGI